MMLPMPLVDALKALMDHDEISMQKRGLWGLLVDEFEMEGWNSSRIAQVGKHWLFLRWAYEQEHPEYTMDEFPQEIETELLVHHRLLMTRYKVAAKFRERHPD